ncbi:ArsC/Spx/MgsR family protein [Pseudodesulfovibrio sp. zrk46]|uniref:ArsC/Spx/MgsR family protein n=1 Tax=Pseudodesulfovibrio sp. zrk46 TaxID=2725288 RepID=UPI001B36C3BD|nr:ArsC/Spx/MgsR family protein [Pseudodesulfovibrio sp. zrk46]
MDFEIRHIIKETPTKEEFLAWQGIAGVDKKKFVNTNGKRYKDLGLKETIDSMSDAELFGLLENDGMLVKRPILVGDDFVLIGFKKAEWETREW